MSFRKLFIAFSPRAVHDATIGPESRLLGPVRAVSARQGILAFAERVLPRAADLWVQASLDQRQRLQQLFFPQGVAFDGNGFVGTAVTAPAFSYLQGVQGGGERMVDQTGIEPVTS
jgi:hypothetical protein